MSEFDKLKEYAHAHPAIVAGLGAGAIYIVWKAKRTPGIGTSTVPLLPSPNVPSAYPATPSQMGVFGGGGGTGTDNSLPQSSPGQQGNPLSVGSISTTPGVGFAAPGVPIIGTGQAAQWQGGVNAAGRTVPTVTITNTSQPQSYSPGAGQNTSLLGGAINQLTTSHGIFDFLGNLGKTILAGGLTAAGAGLIPGVGAVAGPILGQVAGVQYHPTAPPAVANKPIGQNLPNVIIANAGPGNLDTHLPVTTRLRL